MYIGNKPVFGSNTAHIIYFQTKCVGLFTGYTNTADRDGISHPPVN